MTCRSKLAIIASAMTAALRPWQASEIACCTPKRAAYERGPGRLGVRLADVEAHYLAARGLVHDVRDQKALADNVRAPSRTFSTFASSDR